MSDSQYIDDSDVSNADSFAFSASLGDYQIIGNSTQVPSSSNITETLTETTRLYPANNNDESQSAYSGMHGIVFWFCFSYFSFLAIVMYLFSIQRSSGKNRAFLAGYTLAASTATTSVCYFFMAIDLGRLYEAYGVEVMDGIVLTPGRLLYRPVQPAVYWVRHVEWAISTSLCLFLLAHLASTPDRSESRSRSVPALHRIYAVGMNLCVHIVGLAATLVPRLELSKWTYWVLGLFLFAALFRQLITAAGCFSETARKNRRLQQYRTMTYFMLATWSVYPLIWAISDGRYGSRSGVGRRGFCHPAAGRNGKRN